nr:hypothetical protein [Brevundimonas denitrificans]
MTPTVDSISAGPADGRTSFQSVSSPPENRMNTRHATPMTWAKA